MKYSRLIILLLLMICITTNVSEAGVEGKQIGNYIIIGDNDDFLISVKEDDIVVETPTIKGNQPFTLVNAKYLLYFTSHKAREMWASKVHKSALKADRVETTYGWGIPTDRNGKPVGQIIDVKLYQANVLLYENHISIPRDPKYQTMEYDIYQATLKHLKKQGRL